jgi:hypothetical protein
MPLNAGASPACVLFPMGLLQITQFPLELEEAAVTITGKLTRPHRILDGAPLFFGVGAAPEVTPQ